MTHWSTDCGSGGTTHPDRRGNALTHSVLHYFFILLKFYFLFLFHYHYHYYYLYLPILVLFSLILLIYIPIFPLLPFSLLCFLFVLFLVGFSVTFTINLLLISFYSFLGSFSSLPACSSHLSLLSFSNFTVFHAFNPHPLSLLARSSSFTNLLLVKYI